MRIMGLAAMTDRMSQMVSRCSCCPITQEDHINVGEDDMSLGGSYQGEECTNMFFRMPRSLTPDHTQHCQTKNMLRGGHFVLTSQILYCISTDKIHFVGHTFRADKVKSTIYKNIEKNIS